MFSGRYLSTWVIAASVTVLFCISYVTTAQTWNSLQGPPKARDVRDIAVSSTGTIIYAADKSYLFKSTNSASSWSTTTIELASPLVVACKPGSPDNVVAGVIGTIYLNTSGGSSGIWEAKLTSAGTPLRIAVSPLNSEEMYLGRQGSGGTSSIIRSTTGGSNWLTPITYPSGTNINDITPHPSGSFYLHVWAVGADPNGAAEGTVMASRGVWKSTNLGANWTKKAIFFGPNDMEKFNVKSMAIKSSGPLLFVGTEATAGSSGKVFKSADDGDSWDATGNMGAAVTSVRAIRIRSDADLYVATNAGIFKSTNNGGAWTNLMPSGDNNILSFLFAPSNANLAYATTASTVWKGTTTDGGTSWAWNEVTAGLGRMPISSVAANGNNVYIGSRLHDYLGNYNGTSWSLLGTSGFYSEHLMQNTTTGYLFASGVISQKAALYRSTNSGTSYSSLYTSTTQGTGNIFKGSMPDPYSTSDTYVWGKDGAGNVIHVHSNGARDEFTVGNSSHAVNDIAFASDTGGTVYFGKESEGVWKCGSGAPCNGTQVLTGMTVRSLATNSNYPYDVYAAGSAGLRRSSNSGNSGTWTTTYAGDLRRVILSPGYPNSITNIIILRNDGSKILYSPQGGVGGWAEVQGSLPTPIYDIWGEAGSSPVVYAATDNGAYRIYPPVAPANLTVNLGYVPRLNWESVSGASGYHVQVATDAQFNNIVIDQKNIAGILFSAQNLSPGIQYHWRVASGNFVGESAFATSASSFTITGSQTITITTSVVIGTDGLKHPRITLSNNGASAINGAHVYRTSYEYGLPACSGIFSYIGTMSGVTQNTYWDDYGVVVYAKPETPTMSHCYQVRSSNYSNNAGPLHSADGGGGGEGKSAIGRGDPSELLPRETQLRENFPNPFNPITTINYDLADNLPVKLAIYDVLGREAATLVDEDQQAGYKSVEFNADHLPSGVYFYRLQAGKYSSIKKMILLK